MRQFLAFIIAVAVLVTPALAADESAAPGGDPDACTHHFEATVIREATCSEKGLLAYSCSKCGLSYTAEILPDGEHEYELAETTATCTEDGENIYVCTRCGDTYAEAAPAVGHTPEEQPATCSHSQICEVCGEILSPATGHDYKYQYDAEQDADGGFVTFGTWKCANCGRTMDATEGNALYYYSLPESDTMANAATGSDTVVDGEAENDSATDTAAVPAEEEDASSQAGAPNPRNSLWVVISSFALVAIVAEAIVLVRSLSKKKVER